MKASVPFRARARSTARGGAPLAAIRRSLTQEHAIMLGLADAVESAWRSQDDDASRAGRRALLILHRALDRHEKIEESLFSGRFPVTRAAAKAGAAVEADHRELDELRREVAELVGRVDARGVADLRTAALALAGRLRVHFNAEESLLWPLLSALPRRTSLRALADRARTQERLLAREVAEYAAAVDEYL